MTEQMKAIASKIASLKEQVTGYGLEDTIVMNQIRSYEHKLQKLKGEKPQCEIDDEGECLSCGA